MFFILSKTLEFLILPLTWIIIMFLWGLIRFRKPKGKLLVQTAFIMLVIFTNPFIANSVMQAWETESVSMASIEKPYDVAILMGGSLRYYNSEMQRPVFSGSVDRLIQTIYLYKNGKIKNILLSGGSGRLLLQDEKESEIIVEVLKNAGVADSDIILENNSRNTYENAIESVKILNERFPGKSYLLVTSSFHMRRSLACFVKTGISPDPYPVDEKSGKGTLTPDRLILPDSESLGIWETLMHEWVGYIIYKLNGYL